MQCDRAVTPVRGTGWQEGAGTPLGEVAVWAGARMPRRNLTSELCCSELLGKKLARESHPLAVRREELSAGALHH